MRIEQSDIQKLRESPIESVAERLGLMVRNHKSLCPFHDDQRPSLIFNRTRNTYHCFVCEAHGGPIDLVMHLLNLPFADACQWLASERSIVLSSETARRKQRNDNNQPQVKRLDVGYLESLVRSPLINRPARQFLYDERRIDERVVSWLGISSISYDCPIFPMHVSPCFNGPALLIPYRDMEGKLLNVQARYLGQDKEKPRFQFPKGSTCNIFNLPVLKLLREGEPLFITEGVTDCMAMLSAGHKAVAIPSASLLKPSEIMPLKSMNVHMFPDSDLPGEKLFFELKDLLPQLMRHDLPAGVKDFGQLWASSKSVNVNC